MAEKVADSQLNSWKAIALRHLATADLDGDGEPEIPAGGVNDVPEYKQATLLVFDPSRLAGATPNPRGGSYFQGMAPVSPKRTIFFPKTAVSQREEFNRLCDIRVQKERIMVDAEERNKDRLTRWRPESGIFNRIVPIHSNDK